jgi:YidC/Oxa1 family membrane protein insertase
LGWAVVLLTIFLRILLLPLTIISERNAVKQDKARLEADAAIKSFPYDHVAQQEEIRKIMKKNKISPWAKVATLLIQLLVLVLLYQVFVSGITGIKMAKLLYTFIDFPGTVNTIFYGFDIGKVNDMVWPSITALYLLMSIYIENRHEKKWQYSQVIFLFLFPLFTFVALWILPIVKSLFILTSMMFSDIVTGIRKLLTPTKKA